MLVCPYCGKKQHKLFALKLHVKRLHTNYCPICGEFKQNLGKHVYGKARQHEKEHMILFALMNCHNKNRKNLRKNGFLRKCLKIAIKNISKYEKEVFDKIK